MTTLTREALLSKCQQRTAAVDVPGFGLVHLRSMNEVQRSRRLNGFFDGNGKPIESKQSRRRIYEIIDTVVSEDGSPMFTDGDIAELEALDGSKLDPLIGAIRAFEEPDEKKDGDASSDTDAS